MERTDYLEGNNDVVLVQNRLTSPLNLGDAIRFVQSTDPRTKIPSPYAGVEQLSFIPSTNLWSPVDSMTVASYISPQFLSQLCDTAYISPNTNLLYKNGFAMYALVANNKWKRPLYYSPMLPKEMYWGLEKYFVSEGIVSGVEPVKRDSTKREMVDTAKMYRYLMHEYNFRSIADNRVYLDETCKRMIEYYIDAFVSATDAFVELGDTKHAEALLDRCFAVLPPERVGWSYKWIPLIEAYYRSGAKEKGDVKLQEYVHQCMATLRYIKRLSPNAYRKSENEISINTALLQELMRLAQRYASREMLNELDQELGGVLNS